MIGQSVFRIPSSAAFRMPRGPSMPGLSIGIKSKINWNVRDVKQAVERGKTSFLKRAGAYTRTVAVRSIKQKGYARKAPKNKYKADGRTWTVAYRRWWAEVKQRPASLPGSPPHTHTASGWRKAIFWAVEPSRRDVVIGFARSKADLVGKLHEYGGVRFGRRYPARPTMGPAKKTAAPKFARFWQDKVHR